MKNEKTVVDIDYAEAIVPKSARRGIVTMFMIMLGFTFFSASMWVGQQLADGLDFQGFVVSMIVGGVILSLYTGLLGYVGAETGMSLDLLARKAFGVKGSYLPSAMISFTQIGWFGVGIAMFAIPVANDPRIGTRCVETASRRSVLSAEAVFPFTVIRTWQEISVSNAISAVSGAIS